ncbi:MAG: sulfatase-like hydrolase/transferase [Nocardioides sp.]
MRTLKVGRGADLTTHRATAPSAGSNFWRWLVGGALLFVLAAAPPASGLGHLLPSGRSGTQDAAAPAAAAAVRPNVFFYNLDDLRDAFPGGIDPLDYMPQVRTWMVAGKRYKKTFVVNPSCCPSRSSLMTGRFPHNNGILLQGDGPRFDFAHSMGCYLDGAGYATYADGKFLTTWPRDQRPPCFDHSTVMFGGYNNVNVRVDGVSQKAPGYSTTYLGTRGREYITAALAGSAPFLLYETPQAPHWVDVTQPDGTTTDLAVPDAKYRDAPVGPCAGIPEADRSDKPAYVRRAFSVTTARAQEVCESMMRAVMTADDEFGATMQLLADRGVLDDTLVIFSSDNGFNWGEHGRMSKFTPYEPSMRVPLLMRWPGHIAAGTNTARLVSYVDILPTILQAAQVTLPVGAPPLDGESLLRPTSRTTLYGEHHNDPTVPAINTWRMVRTATAKYVENYDAAGAVVFREYYNLVKDPAENTNALGDANTANDPPAATVAALASTLTAYSTCSGSACVR